MRFEALRACLRLQTFEPNTARPGSLTAFGRARWMTGTNPLHSDHEPPFYMVYWLRVPVYEWRTNWSGGRLGWYQAVWVWSGEEGFFRLWVEA